MKCPQATVSSPPCNEEELSSYNSYFCINHLVRPSGIFPSKSTAVYSITYFYVYDIIVICSVPYTDMIITTGKTEVEKTEFEDGI